MSSSYHHPADRQPSSHARAPVVSRLSSPFDLIDRINPPRFRIDPVPFLDLLIIALAILLISNRLLFVPGLSLDLPKAESDAFAATRVDAVLTVVENHFILRDGVYSLETLGEGLSRAAESSSVNPDPVLLLKIDRAASADLLQRITHLAMEAGFSRIHLATSPERPRSPKVNE